MNFISLEWTSIFQYDISLPLSNQPKRIKSNRWDNAKLQNTAFI